MITRRDASRLVLAGTAAVLLPLPAAAQSQKERERILGLWKTRLEDEMNALVAGNCRARFTVLDYQYIPGGGQLEMSAVIQLDWPPGFLRRLFRETGNGAEPVYKSLRGAAAAEFRRNAVGCLA
jgi:hypothetical protein